MQIVNIDLIPQKDKPIVDVSQYDNNRVVRFMLFENSEEYSLLGGETIEVNIRKPDKKLVVITPEVSAGRYVDVYLTEQACACFGDAFGELSIISGDTVIGTCNFILRSEISPMLGGLTSESEIANLTSQIEEIIPEVLADDYYTKTQTDALLDEKADISSLAAVATSGSYNDLTDKPDIPDVSNYYTKSQTDTLLNGKADASTTYTKTEVDNALTLKANSSDLATVATTGDYDDLINKPTIPAAQVQSDYAQIDNTKVDYIKNKPDISGMINAAIFDILPVGSASGNPCSFETAIAANLQSCIAEIVASGGNGTPSTPVPIVGYSAVNLNANGTTVTISLGQTVYGGVLDVKNGSLTDTFKHSNTTTVYNSYGNAVNGWRRFIIDGTGDCKFTSDTVAVNSKSNIAECIDATTLASIVNNSQITDVTYAFASGAQNRLVIALPVTTVEDAETYLGNITGGFDFIYELATPIEITGLTPTDIQTLLGVNNISSDAGGDVSVSYKDTIQHYIDTRI